jgi:hypothetical protein
MRQRCTQLSTKSKAPTMKTKFLTMTLLLLISGVYIYAQPVDSTSRFSLSPIETIAIKTTFGDSTTFASESDRSSFLILDPQIRHCFLTVKLIEYKSGKKIAEKNIFTKFPISDNTDLRSFEDSSMVFALYRKNKIDNQYIWGFRLPAAFDTQVVQLYDTKDSYTTVAIPQNFLNGRIPIGKPFPLLLITQPDETNNFPFYRTENKNKYPVTEWNEKFKLKHTFLIELLIEKNEFRNSLSTTRTL